MATKKPCLGCGYEGWKSDQLCNNCRRLISAGKKYDKVIKDFEKNPEFVFIRLPEKNMIHINEDLKDFIFDWILDVGVEIDQENDRYSKPVEIFRKYLSESYQGWRHREKIIRLRIADKEIIDKLTDRMVLFEKAEKTKAIKKAKQFLLRLNDGDITINDFNDLR